MSAKNFIQIPKYSYKALCFVKHRILLEKNVYIPLQKELNWNNKIVIYPNLHLLKTSKTENIQFKSIVIYKFDNDKIYDIEYDEINNVFTTNCIDGNAIIKYKEIYFDSNRMNEYYKNLNDLEKFFETN